ncbi:uncharacterized protein TRIADDRAFT_52064 [Trichoplax adhaerens]|uniref:Uncharacterized protein n=2 Tax=Trichoplax adhaerens TaxID=10228 RepID=B3RLN4_TRIAD|nr:hypothetical protein TRIADDRAFT_52064 [Trichoplax adhaerens]EDV28815.1 hypothetical protein TRIADDRAFT_52064 [Trichoplax adhaerens]|eukprot:XP_002108017.1 hypothetical protein TRIADDRAFT_52064 [Trichoplax adhaerens]
MTTTRGKIVVKVADYFEKKLDQDAISQIHNFSKFVFEEMITCANSSIFQFDALNGLKKYLLVPILRSDSRYDLDFEVLNLFCKEEHKLYVTPASHDYIIQYENAMVARNYRGLDTLEWFFVSNVCSDMSPSSKFTNPDVASTYSEYYKIKYDIDIQDANQPLLEVARFKKMHITLLNAKQSGSITHDIRTLSVNSNSNSIVLIPELCLIHVIPAELWFLSQYLALVLYRVESILLAFELRELLRSQANICDIYSVDYLITAVGSAKPCLLEAITLSSAQDHFNLERLEFLGDRYLNYKITLTTLLEHPSWSINEVINRMRFLTKNKKLFRLGAGRRIPYYIVGCPFNQNKSWVPPGFVINQTVSELSIAMSREYTHQPLTKKAIADCVEGLIGYLCLVCGRNSVLRFMRWLGFEISECLDGIQELIPSIDFRTNLYSETANSVETILNYSFRNRSLLMLALTHKSYSGLESISYEKLAFLGDTLLIYQICLFLYTQYTDYQPKDYHLLLEYLTCNRMYGIVAIASDLCKFLLHKSRELTLQIDEIYQALEADDVQSFSSTVQSGCSYKMKTTLLLEKLSIEQFVPKELGDTFAAVVAAVFLDNYPDEDTAGRIINSLLNPIFDVKYTCEDNLPVSLTQQMYESLPNRVRTFFVDNKSGSYSICNVSVVLKNSTEKTFAGKGKDHEHAKTLAMAALTRYIDENPNQFQ